MKKVIYLINSFQRGGAEQGILNLLDAEFFSDVEITIVTLFGGESSILDEIKQKHNIKTLALCKSDKLTMQVMLLSLVKFPLVLLRMRPQVMILSLTQANIIGRLWAMLSPQLKVVSFEHTTKLSKNVYEKILKALSWRVNGVFTDDPLTEAYAKSLFIKADKKQWFYIPLFFVNGIIEKKTCIIQNEIKILSVGRLSPEKNYEGAINSLKLLKDAGVNASLSIAGEGEELDNLKSLAKKLDVKVNFLGFQKKWTDIANQYDIYLLSSHYEGLSIATVEAMAVGMPVVAEDIGGIKTYGRHNENMLIASEGNKLTREEAIKMLIDSEELRQGLAIQAKEDINKSFSEKAVKQQLAKAKAYIGS